MCDGASAVSNRREWTPGLEIPPNAAFWCLEPDVFRRAICTLHDTHYALNLRKGTMACDRYRFGSLGSFRVAPAGKHTSQASLAPAVLP
jgi:hypothetical protein